MTDTITEPTTEEVVFKMLTENTGTHFLDSGGAYGRNWERNQAKSIDDFKNEPEVSLAFYIRTFNHLGAEERHEEIDATISVFHFLVAACDYTQWLDELFHDIFVPYFDKVTGDDNHWLALMENFQYWLDNFAFKGKCIDDGLTDDEKEDCDRHDHQNPFMNLLVIPDDEIGQGWGIPDDYYPENYTDEFAAEMAETWDDFVKKYGDSAVIYDLEEHNYERYRDSETVNTYNHEDLLSQTLQYTTIHVNGEHFALIQIHGGCDVRGGYTKPRAFSVDEDGGTSLYDNARYTLYVNIPDPSEDEGVQPRLDGSVPERLTEASWTCFDGHSLEPNNREPDWKFLDWISTEEAETVVWNPEETIVVNLETKEAFYMGGKLEAGLY